MIHSIRCHIKKTYKIIFIVLFIIIFCLLLGYIILDSALVTSTYGRVYFSNSNNGIIIKNGFIFDTGANGSCFSNTKDIEMSVFLFPIFISDTYGSQKIVPAFFGKKLSINDKVSFHNFIFISSPEVFSNHSFMNIKGIIGMNMIYKTNFYISFVDNYIEFMPKDSIMNFPISAICLNFEDSITPTCSMKIGDVVFDNILIDTGFDRDLALKESDIDNYFNLLSDYTTNITTNNTLFNVKEIKTISFNRLRLNLREYKDVVIISSNKRLLGLKFFKRFNHVFWNNKDRKVYFWN